MDMEKIKELIKDMGIDPFLDVFIVRDGGAWNVGLMHSGIRYGSAKNPDMALKELIKNIKINRGLFQ